MYGECVYECVCPCVVSAGPSVLCDGIRQRRRPDVSHSDSWQVQRAARSVCSQKAPFFYLESESSSTASHFLPFFYSLMLYIHTHLLALFIIPGDS